MPAAPALIVGGSDIFNEKTSPNRRKKYFTQGFRKGGSYTTGFPCVFMVLLFIRIEIGGE